MGTSKVKTYYLILQKTCHKIEGIDKQSKNILSDSTKKIATKYMGMYFVAIFFVESDSIFLLCLSIPCILWQVFCRIR
jgi:hypothetical protein